MTLVGLHGFTLSNTNQKHFLPFVILMLWLRTLLVPKLKFLGLMGGGEYKKKEFLHLLSSSGIQHQRSCPHTSQQNGIAKRKYRHIVETELT